MRRPLPAGLVVWIVTAIILSSAAAYFTARTVMHRHEHGSGDGVAPEEDLHEWMHDQLKISEEQWAKLEPFEEEFEERRTALLKTIGEGGDALAAAIRKGQRDAPDVQEALDRINKAHSELQKITLDHFFVMKEHLDPDQAELLIEWTHDSITRQHHR